jgi:hypothetical protein
MSMRATVAILESFLMLHRASNTQYKGETFQKALVLNLSHTRTNVPI